MGEGDELSGGEGDWWWKTIEVKGHVHISCHRMSSKMIHITHERLKRYNSGALWPKRHPNVKFLFESLPEVSSKAPGTTEITQPNLYETSSCHSSAVEDQIRLLILEPVISLQLVRVKISDPFIIKLAPNVPSRGIPNE